MENGWKNDRTYKTPGQVWGMSTTYLGYAVWKKKTRLIWAMWLSHY